MNNFITKGYDYLGTAPADKCKNILSQIKSTRNFGPDLFLSETDFYSQKDRYGTNPHPGRNIVETLDLNFISEFYHSRVKEVLGPKYFILFHKAVCGVPYEWLPEYVKKEIDMVPVANLGAFIKPEYRDITYFHGIDYHQDIIDYKDRLTDFITLYVYLDNVTENDAPLFLLPESHKEGATTFPHDLVKVNDKYIYNQNQELSEIVLTGPAGTTYFWHSTTLHGTQPTKASSPRISLRYLISKHRSELDFCNEFIEGPLKLSNTRIDVNDKHIPVIKHNLLKTI